MDWFLGGMKKEGPAFMLNAGDIMDARWWESPAQVRKETNYWWSGFRKRFEDKEIQIYIAPGDHEYGDDQGLTEMHLAPVFADQFKRIFDMPKNGPGHMRELAYSFSRENLAVITVNTFEDAGNRMSMTVSGKQLDWLEEQLKMYRDQGKEFIIVQGHVPVVGPVESKNSSANMLEGGTGTQFWKTMVKYGVDVYLCGEHHRITVKKHDGIWQIVHGALWGTQTDVNYLRGSVYPGKLKLELFQFLVEYSEEYIQTDHPHRGPTSRPHAEVSISRDARENGPDSLGRLIIEHKEGKSQAVEATGVFQVQ
ncbi:MAG: metallophosphoesterase family protein [Bacteroidota bacterium]